MAMYFQPRVNPFLAAPCVVRRLPDNPRGVDIAAGQALDARLARASMRPGVDRVILCGNALASPDLWGIRSALELLRTPGVHAVRGQAEQHLLHLADTGRLEIPSPRTLKFMADNGLGWWGYAGEPMRHEILDHVGAMPLAIEIERAGSEPDVFVHHAFPTGTSWSRLVAALECDDPYSADCVVYGGYRNAGVSAESAELTPAVSGARAVYVAAATSAALPGNVVRLADAQLLRLTPPQAEAPAAPTNDPGHAHATAPASAGLIGAMRDRLARFLDFSSTDARRPGMRST